MTDSIGFIGGGNMAASLIGGLISQGEVSRSQLSVFEPNTEKALALTQKFGIHNAANNIELIERSNIVVIAVKPQVLQQVLMPIAESLRNKQPLIVSIVAGITIRSIEKWLNSKFAVVRVMPNTPALVGVGASGLYANARVTQEQRSISNALLNAVGKSAWVSSEADLNSVTALSGSGPAYFMLFIQGLIEAAEAAGLPPKIAKQLAVQTAAGAAHLVASSDTPLQTLIDNVTSPNGTTEKALQSFNNDELKSVVHKAFNAAKQRSEELAKELG